MKIRPLGNRALVRPLEEEKMTASGIVLPDTVDREKKIEAEVVALGDGKRLAKYNLKPGDRVIIEKWGAPQNGARNDILWQNKLSLTTRHGGR